MGKGAWGGTRLSEAAVSMVGGRAAAIPIVIERNERARRGTVDDRKPVVGHRRDDTRRGDRIAAHSPRRRVPRAAQYGGTTAVRRARLAFA